MAYPVGRFVTHLAGPEIAEARRLGHLVSIGPGYLHRLSPHMAEWARWVLAVTGDGDQSTPKVCRRAVKHWGRAVIGKTAAKGWQTRPLETLGGTGWDYRPAWNAELQSASHLIEICGVAAEVIADGDGDNAYPAILAWVESWTRVYLARSMDAAGPENVITCDTDGFIVAGDADAVLAKICTAPGPLKLRAKNRYEQVRVIGPQHVITPTDRKLAGVPQSAEPNDDGELVALLWPKLATQMSLRPGGTEPGYLRPVARYTLPESTVTGWVTFSGLVDPLRAVVCASGGTHVLGPPEAAGDHYPAELQSRHLAELITPIPGEGEKCSFHTFRSNGTTGGSPRSDPTMCSKSSPSRARRGVARVRGWLNTGRTYSSALIRVFSGRTRT